MRQIQIISIFTLVCILFVGCDCVQKATGVVLDAETKQPINKAAFGKYEKYDADNSFSRQSFSDEEGHFEFRSLGGGIGPCDFDLYISKEGYETMKIYYDGSSGNDTIYLKRIK